MSFRYTSAVGFVLLRIPLKKTSLLCAHVSAAGVRANDKSARTPVLQSAIIKLNRNNDFRRMIDFPYRPMANKIALLIAYTVPSTPIKVGVYASPMPGVSVNVSESVLEVKSQRYNLPSSLPASTDRVKGST